MAAEHGAQRGLAIEAEGLSLWLSGRGPGRPSAATGYRGVVRLPNGCYRAEWREKWIYGSFATAVEAAVAYAKARAGIEVRYAKAFLNARAGVEQDVAEEAVEFYASAAFDGAAEGYVFRSGDRGVGYYRDVVPSQQVVEHFDGVKLHLAPYQASSTASTGYKGVQKRFYPRYAAYRFTAVARVDGEPVPLGWFDTAVEAAVPYMTKKREL